MFEYEVKRYRRARRMRIIVKPGGRVVVSMPWRLPKYLARQFVDRQADWIVKARVKMSRVAPRLHTGSVQEYKQYKQAAQQLFEQRLTELNQALQFLYKRVSVRNQKTRWGSCSKTGVISLNYRLIFLSAELLDYVLIHELCHLREMNHSRRFWQLVGLQDSNYKLHRRQLCVWGFRYDQTRLVPSRCA